MGMSARMPDKPAGARTAIRRLAIPAAGVVAVLWVLLVAVVDCLTGPELSLSALYLPAVGLAAWYVGRTGALYVALLAAAIWPAVELLGIPERPSHLVLIWNTGIRFLVFMVTAILVSELRIRLGRETLLIQRRSLLRAILDSMTDGVVVVGENRRIMLYNPAVERLLGRESEGTPVEAWLRRFGNVALANGDDHGGGQAAREMLLGRRYGSCEMQLEGLTGTKLLEVKSIPLLADPSRGPGAILVLTDITTKRGLENEIGRLIEREQRRIGQDVHDGLCQHLTGVAFIADSLQTELGEQGAEASAGRAGQIAALTREAIAQARKLAHGLFPVGLDAGLEQALVALAEETTERAGVRCHFRCLGELPTMHSAAAVHLWRIAQEAVTNAQRHSGAGEIAITLDVRPHELELAVRDNGCGMDLRAPSRHGIGRSIMKYRASLISGRLTFRPAETGGTLVSCIVPTAALPLLTPAGHD